MIKAAISDTKCRIIPIPRLSGFDIKASISIRFAPETTPIITAATPPKIVLPIIYAINISKALSQPLLIAGAFSFKIFSSIILSFFK